RQILGGESAIARLHEHRDAALARAERFALLRLEGSRWEHVLPRRSNDEDEEAALRSGAARVAALRTEASGARSAEPSGPPADVLQGSKDVHVHGGYRALGMGRRD